MACEGIPASRRLAANALAALTASDPAPAQQAIAKIVDLACDMKRYGYFHSDGPVEAAKFVVSEAVRRTWTSPSRSALNCRPVPAR